jgi:hypothetical protein
VSDDLTPAQIEAKLRRLVNDLALAQSALREARDAEVDAKHAYEAKSRKALLSDECPKVTRGGFTTAERDAWVSEQAAAEEKVYDLAEARRKAAEDYLRTLRDQSMIVMALGKSVQAAFSLAGVS